MSEYKGVYLSTLEGLSDSNKVIDAINKLRKIQKQGIPNWRVLKSNPDLLYAIVDSGIVWYFTDNIGNAIIFGYNHGDDENNQDKPFVSLTKSGVLKIGNWQTNNPKGYNKNSNWCVWVVKRQTGDGWQERTVNQLAKDNQLWNRLEEYEKAGIVYPTPLVYQVQNQETITLKSWSPALMIVAGILASVVASPVVAGLITTALGSLKKLISGESNDVIGVLADINNAISPTLNTPSNTDINGFVGNVTSFIKTETKTLLPEETLNISNKGVAIYNALANKDIPSLMGIHTGINMYGLGSLVEFEDLQKIGEDIENAYSNGDIEKIAKLTGDDIPNIEKIVQSVKIQDLLNTAYTQFKVSPKLKDIKEFNFIQDSTIQQYVISTYSSLFNRAENAAQVTQIVPNNKLMTKMIFDDVNNTLSKEEHRALINNLQGEAVNPNDLELITAKMCLVQAQNSQARKVTYYVPSTLPPTTQIKVGKYIKSYGYKVKLVDKYLNQAVEFDREF